ncbi:hypothetical protein TCAL_09426 [Tigriopus californicus]|uniref:Uncharacterized protein n=1 Tax=Tigriopus californicus TaxID=6832 RepID=A0A553PR09_TIGCA|nr:protein C1orf43 homolog [Tigriopus californicus]TRY80111.1 hypothetical protein TCAL_09426 [Tigriopus californicus]|eukprot:TCALIF_09426-PA protein Name:"Similar to Uncharacterized protein C1orf43 homolog (Mus musculus)" AED:0.01 eAED:0.01 QI:588/1/1/1/0.66/0.5/4/126/261
MATEQLSGTIVLIIIAISVQACIMLIIFAKRQIMRFALRNRSGPHMHVGQGAPKAFRREVDRHLEWINHIRQEPQLNMVKINAEKPQHFFRAQAMEAFHQLERAIAGYSANYARPPCSSIRTFLHKCTNGPLFSMDARDIDLLADEYDRARYHYEPFEQKELQTFTERISKLRGCLSRNRANKPHPSPMPAVSLNLGEEDKGRHRKKWSNNKDYANNSANCGTGSPFSKHSTQRGSSRVTLLAPSPSAKDFKSGKNISVDV